MSISCFVACCSSSTEAKSAERISSGQSIVCMTMTPSRTRSTAIVIRVRMETVTTAIRFSFSRASRSSTYGFVGGLVGLEVVGLVEPHRVDLVGWDEPGDADLLRRPRRQVGEVVVGEHDHLAVLGLVPLGDVVVRDLLAVDRAEPPVADAAAVLAVHLPELHVVVLGGGVEPDGHVDEPERDRALPDRAHRASPPSLGRRWSRRRHRPSVGLAPCRAGGAGRAG